MNRNQEQFVKYFCGNVTETSRRMNEDGVKISLRQCKRYMNIPEVIKAIQDREKKTKRKGVMTREERQQLWTDFARDDSLRPSDRLRASELLGKSEADFTERLEHSGEVKTILDYISELDHG